MEAAFRRTIDAALAERVHAVLLAGDLFDSHRPPARVVDLARRELARLREAGIPVLAVPGTHDSLLQPDCIYRREDLPIDRLFDAPTFDGPYRLDADGTAVWVYGIAADPRRTVSDDIATITISLRPLEYEGATSETLNQLEQYRAKVVLLMAA